jgi:putative phosphoesterase
MRVAVLYDIHGNLPALEAVLRDVREADVDQLVVGGDVVPGPMPRETIDCLLDLDIPAQFIQGNGDREVLAQIATGGSAVPQQFREMMRWVGDQLSSKHQRLLAGWPKTLSISVQGLHEVLFCHATPRNDTEIFTALTAEESLLPVFDGLKAPLVICGHTHMQFERTIGPTQVVNAGSVGMPFGKAGFCGAQRTGAAVRGRDAQGLHQC